jgi:iron-sulfur cluster repair protein YtfE (RIC family)
MTTTLRRLFLVLVVALSLSLLSAACSKSVDADLPTHINNIAKIAEDNKDKPAAAVDELHKYLQASLPSILKEVTKLVVQYDKATSDADRKKVMDDAMKSIGGALDKAAGSVMPLMMKVGDDKDAQKKLEDIQKKFEMIGKALKTVGG